MTLSIAFEPLLAYILASVRLGAWLMLVPPFSNRSIPAAAKVLISIGLAVAISPTINGALPVEIFPLTLEILQQVVIGATMGFVTMLLFTALAAAGSLIDQFGGFALASGFDPMSQNTNTVFGKFHNMLAIMLLFVTGAHLLIFGGLIRTFQFLPLGEFPDVSGVPDILSTTFSLFFAISVQIALPMVAVLFIVDMGLAVLTKVAPQLNAFNFMFPAKIGMTLMLIGLSFPVLPEAMRRIVDLMLEAIAGIIGAG